MSISQMYAPVPLLSSHIETPWINPVTKAINNGEKATSNPTRTNGNRFMNSEYPLCSCKDLYSPYEPKTQ
jgi:hypothetical protein